jgi:hypothetical protein
VTGKVEQFYDYLRPDNLGCNIANKWTDWNNARQPFINEIEEIRKYLFATTTMQTSNSALPWKNKTTIPKLTQIRDNLYANYLAVEFPKRKWLDWLANERDANSLEKREAILAYMNWVISQPQYKYEMSKCILDYIDYGNCFALVEWLDQRVERDDKIQAGYVGPMVRRINPLDIVFNPTAPTFIEAPKIIRSLISIGECKKLLESMSTDENREEYEELFHYLMDIRGRARSHTTTAKTGSENLHVLDSFYTVDGFDTFQRYLEGEYVEILTFYGDLFDHEKNELLQNHVIMVADRHKVIGKKPNPSYFGYPPIFHAGWRLRQDNLWAMGPLNNLVGMQYRIDHIENLTADVYDLLAYPMLKIKGYVNDSELGPLQRIVTDNEGDVEILSPPWQMLQPNGLVERYEAKMEEMAGSPKEAMGFRTPGEKTAFEVQRLENAASRIFINKTGQWDDQFHERVLNGCLEMARRNIQGPQEINVFDNQFNMQTFMTLTADDITGAGRIKPLAARHFAEKAELVQNLSNLYQSGIGQDPLVMAHFSGKKIAKIVEDALDLSDYEAVQDFVRVGEQAEMQRLAMATEEQTLMQATTPSGMTPDDVEGPDIMSSLGPQIPPNV